jgi:chromate reductase
MNALVLGKPEVFIGMAQTKFDATTGRCSDAPTRKIMTELLAAFERWIGSVARMKG